MSQILTSGDIPLMREACQLAAQVLVEIEPFVQPGVTTEKLDSICHDYILSQDATPAPLGYQGFPKSICTSVNTCVCHGVPDSRVLNEGDLINIDVTCIKNGFHGDTSKTFFVGEVSDRARKITEVAFQAMQKGIEALRPGGATGDVGFAVNRYVTKKGFFPVEEIGGHGIGRVFHDSPFVPSVGKKGRGEKIEPWSCLTVEPMINERSSQIREFEIPHSTIKYYHTVDGGLSAQFEHTVLVMDGEGGVNYEILTLPKEVHKRI